jgi:hypothetical protein
LGDPVQVCWFDGDDNTVVGYHHSYVTSGLGSLAAISACVYCMHLHAGMGFLPTSSFSFDFMFPPSSQSFSCQDFLPSFSEGKD